MNSRDYQKLKDEQILSVPHSQFLYSIPCLALGTGPPTPATPYIHSVISGNKSRALEAMGGCMKGRKESCSWSWLNGGLSHLERPVYSPSIIALIL